MADVTASLWPTEIRVDVASPLVILRNQADLLSKITEGILKAMVISYIETTSYEEHVDRILTTYELLQDDANVTTIRHELIVHAPTYNTDFKLILLCVEHEKGIPYPCRVTSRGIVDEDSGLFAVASTDAAFRDILSKIFNSDYAKGLLSALIAQSNEAKLLVAS